MKPNEGGGHGGNKIHFILNPIRFERSVGIMSFFAIFGEIIYVWIFVSITGI
jgi:hypothetical protein